VIEIIVCADNYSVDREVNTLNLEKEERRLIIKKVSGTKSLYRFLNALVLGNYTPRAVDCYMCAQE
jgi:hypothetical protein